MCDVQNHSVLALLCSGVNISIIFGLFFLAALPEQREASGIRAENFPTENYNFREDATSYVAKFHAGLLFRSNWNFVLFVLGWRVGESKNPEKNPLEKAKTSNKLNPVMERARNQATLATSVGA